MELFSPEALSAGEVLSRWGLGESSVAARSDGEPVDITAVIEKDSFIEPISSSSQEGLDILRHSTSHLMAQA
ncbi:MAG: threonine--tRNA ligase, partial [Thermovirgaceae bacterium]